MFYFQKGHSSEEELECGEEPDTDRLSDLNQQKVSSLRTPFIELGGHTGAVSAADWLSGAEQVITASWDRSALMHDVETGRILTTFTGKISHFTKFIILLMFFQGHDQELTYTAAHPSQKLAVTASRDTTFRLWDFREISPLVSVFQGHTE